MAQSNGSAQAIATSLRHTGLPMARYWRTFTKGDIWLLSMEGERKAEPFLQTEFDESLPRFSPDGRWIAYDSDESGQLEVYIRPYPRSEGRQQVSTRGGTEARWNSNGKEIFYRAGNAMMAVDVDRNGSGDHSGQPGKTLRPAFVDR